MPSSLSLIPPLHPTVLIGRSPDKAPDGIRLACESGIKWRPQRTYGKGSKDPALGPGIKRRLLRSIPDTKDAP
jgi:hypothetical protein